MKKLLVIMLASFLVLTGCNSKIEKEEKVVQNSGEKTESIIPKFQISDSYYKVLLPYEPSEARGLIVSSMRNRIDMDAFEEGMMKIATEYFNPKEYVFQEGQTFKRLDVERLTIRKRTPQQQLVIEESKKVPGSKKKPNIPNIGLNPPIESGKKGDSEKEDKERNEGSPEYISHILEHNYLKVNKDGQAQLKGMVIGLAMNSHHYYNTTEGGYPRDIAIDDDVIRKQGKEMAQQVLKFIREKYPEVSDVPIVFTIYKQGPKQALAPGAFLEKASVGKGETTIRGWDKIDEEWYVFPSSEATQDYRDDAAKVSNFKADIVNYFPNYTGVIGKGYYQNGELRQMKLDITIQFNSKAEVVGFTQYVVGLMQEHFPSYIEMEISIKSNSKTEAIVIREAKKEEPIVQIF